MKKTIIGVNLKYRKMSIAAAILFVAGMFLPYVNRENGSFGGMALAVRLAGEQKLSGMACVLPAAIAFAVISLGLGIYMCVRPSVIGSKVWVAVQAAGTAAMSILLFASKSFLDGSGILGESFLVKNFGYGYWIALVAAFVCLYFSMKMAKVNTGYIVLAILSIIWLFPILWIILTAFRAESGYYVAYFFPKHLSFGNFASLFKATSPIPFAKWWLNTFVVAIATCICSTLIILATSYVLSRTRFAARKGLMKFMLIIGMFPGFMSMIAVYNILKGLGLAQTLVALVVVSAAGSAMGYYICKGFFDTIPKALDEAAIIDGCTRWQIFTKITIPLSKPIIVYTVLTSFLGPWTDYIFPSMVLGDKQASYTVALGLKWMTDFKRIDTYYTQFAAGALLVSLPIVILFIFLQKYYVEGLSGAVKG